MRKIITLLCFLIPVISQAQYFWTENFDDTGDIYLSRFIIDTVNYHHNIWQIGRPRKAVFTAAYSYPNVIVTDTVNPYPPRDTSVFVIKQAKNGAPFFELSFLYKLDIDSGAKVMVEVSGDSGNTWINPLTEDTIYQFYWGWEGKPRLDTSTDTGSSTLTWKNFDLNMDNWITSYPGGPDSFPSYPTADTILFRFTFISDTDTVTKDGWMMDDFLVGEAIHEGLVNEVHNNNLISIYPNPTSGDLYVHCNKIQNGTPEVHICNMTGQEIYYTKSIPPNGYLHLSLPPGVYTLRYSLGNEYAIKKLVITK